MTMIIGGILTMVTKRRLFPRSLITGAAWVMLLAILVSAGGSAQGYRKSHPADRGKPRGISISDPRSISPTLKQAYSAWRARTRQLKLQNNPPAPTPSADGLITTLIDEGFEGAVFPPAGWSSVVLEGSPDWVQSNSSPRTGTYSAYSEFSPLATSGKKFLITKRVSLTSALSYRLSFYLKRAFIDAYDPDTVKILLSTIDSLPGSFSTLLYQCSTGPDTSTDPDVYTTSYKLFSTEFTGRSGTAWIAFDHEDNEGQGIDLDDVTLEEIVKNDIGVLSIDEPLAGARKNQGNAFQPKATFKNFGDETQSSIPVRMKIVTSTGTVLYNNTQTISSLTPGSSQQVTFTSFSPSSGGHLYARASAENPGDAVHTNDSLSQPFLVPGNVSGTKTVGPGGDFTSVSDALQFLRENNLSGPLTFELIASAYAEPPLVIDEIKYTTVAQPCVIKPAAGVSPMINVIATPVNRFGIRFNGTSFLTLDGSNDGYGERNLTIEIDTTGWVGDGIRLIGGCTNITVKNLTLKGFRRADYLAGSGVYLDTVSGARRDSALVFENLHLLRCFNGFYFNPPPEGATSIRIARCEFGGTGLEGITQVGIAAFATDALVIESNNIGQIVQPGDNLDAYGIYLGTGCTHGIVRMNRIHGIKNFRNSWIAVGLYTSTETESYLLCYDNFFYDILSSGAGAGGNASYGTYSYVNGSESYYYNSFYLTGYDSSGSSASESAGMKFEGSTGFDVKNTIIVNGITLNPGFSGNRSACLNLAEPSWPAGASSDHNDLMALGTNGTVGMTDHFARLTLSAWQTGTGQDPNSISADPLFADSEDLHIRTDMVHSPVDSQAIPIAGITKDFDGEARSSTFPDIGADEFSDALSISGSVDRSWNLVSLPAIVADPAVSAVFPGALTGYAFAYQDGYSQEDSLVVGTGYWLKFPTAQSVTVTGFPVSLDSVDLRQGWNLIGSIVVPVRSASLATVPAGILVGQFYKYDLGYQFADTLKPFRGYWIKASKAGKLVLAVTALKGEQAAGSSSGSEIPGTLNTLVLRDASGAQQRLYFGSGAAGNPRECELPPVPPANVFDSRFGSGTMVWTHGEEGDGSREQPILVRSAHYPLTVEWDMRGGNSAAYTLRFNGKENTLEGGRGILHIQEPFVGVMTLRFSTHGALPAAFQLSQNFPNPFNPSTIIRYAVPVESMVRLKVFNILGQEVAILVDQVQKAGYKSARWNASSFPSGIYFYRIDASGTSGQSKRYVEVRKMTLIK